MYNPLPVSTPTVDAIRVSPWLKVPGAEYCAMRIVEGTDPSEVANRVAFIEKTPRVRVGVFSDTATDFRNWHAGWKGSDGWCEEAQGWCDVLLTQMGYSVPDAREFAATASDFADHVKNSVPAQRQRQDATAYQMLDLEDAARHFGLPPLSTAQYADLREHYRMPEPLRRALDSTPALAPLGNMAPDQAKLALHALANHLGLYDAADVILR